MKNNPLFILKNVKQEGREEGTESPNICESVVSVQGVSEHLVSRTHAFPWLRRIIPTAV